MRKSLLGLACLLGLLLMMLATPTYAWSNGGWSSDPYNPDYGTHDYLFEHALNMLPSVEKSAIVHNLSLALYGTEMPDNPDEICDTYHHHVYYNSAGQLTDEAAAERAEAEYDLALWYLQNADWTNADKHMGAMSHYITDLAVFGHVMGAYTDWGAEVHHSDYEDYVKNRTTSCTSSTFDGYIVYDGSLTGTTAYNAVIDLAYTITFGSGNVKSCTWMDSNYSWSNSTFKDSCGASMDLAANYLAEVLHKLYSDYTATNNAPILSFRSLSPSSGTAGTTFTYEVTYIDTDGDAPLYVQLYIDNTAYSMTKISGTYSAGAVYSYTKSSLATGSHTYYFSASDNQGATARLPTSGTYSGPTVTGTDNDQHLIAGVSISLANAPDSVSVGETFNMTVTVTKPQGTTVTGRLRTYLYAPADQVSYPLPDEGFSYVPLADGGWVPNEITVSLGENELTGIYTFSLTVNSNVAITGSSAQATLRARLRETGANVQIAPDSDKNVTLFPSFEVTLTVSKPDGSLLANTAVYYGFSSGQETTYLGTTDNQGRLTLDNSALAGKTVYFKTSDGAYAGSTYIGSSGGDVATTLAEAADTGPPIKPAVAATLVGCGVASGLALFLKRRGRVKEERAEEKGKEEPRGDASDIPAIGPR